CKENEKDIKDINQIYLEGLTFHFVKDIKEVLKIALLDEKVEDALTIE
ncbi:MAG: S16 family serine protease, partial [Bacteroidota bacterium]|nr:S16 family serine protease [Bacteroidota bacterium]